MHPVFEMFGAHVHAYALFTWVAAFTACILAIPALKKAGWPLIQSLILLFGMCIGFLVGARLWNVVVNPLNFVSMPWYALKLAGMSLYGGLFGSMLVLIVCVRVMHRRVLAALDAMVIPGGVAFCLSRVGCFLNGCCAGIATKGPFGVVFPSDSWSVSTPSILSFLNKQTVHPTQLYELAGAVVGLVIIVLLTGKRAPGVRFFGYAAVFSAVRLAVLPLRSLSYRSGVKTVAYPVLYWCVIFGGILAVFLLMGKYKGFRFHDGALREKADT